jgi:hypothetical protein
MGFSSDRKVMSVIGIYTFEKVSLSQKETEITTLNVKTGELSRIWKLLDITTIEKWTLELQKDNNFSYCYDVVQEHRVGHCIYGKWTKISRNAIRLEKISEGQFNLLNMKFYNDIDTLEIQNKTQLKLNKMIFKRKVNQ